MSAFQRTIKLLKSWNVNPGHIMLTVHAGPEETLNTCVPFSSITLFIIHLQEKLQHLFPIVAPSISFGSDVHAWRLCMCVCVCSWRNGKHEFDDTARASLSSRLCRAQKNTTPPLKRCGSAWWWHCQSGGRGVNRGSLSEQNGGPISWHRGGREGWSGGLEGGVVLQTDEKNDPEELWWKNKCLSLFEGLEWRNPFTLIQYETFPVISCITGGRCS